MGRLIIAGPIQFDRTTIAFDIQLQGAHRRRRDIVKYYINRVRFFLIAGLIPGRKGKAVAAASEVDGIDPISL